VLLVLRLLGSEEIVTVEDQLRVMVE